ncbi:major facilitator superfamily domain-containing protein [Penicillium angulare]|uniref:Major facilitator superfamily domain-containing protein n=1 Tax=Penicillium angulare TaxID=116970 RepID=A0A9W9F4W0_9EURO|nr:major facilitator superfamily domain-containing protein [Penicillium angulare]
MSEKISAPLEVWGKGSEVASLDDGSDRPGWSESEEKALLRKCVYLFDNTIQAQTNTCRSRLDFFLMPLLIAGLFVLQLDRSDISNALSDTITEDLHITSDDVNFGSQLSLIGIVIAEIPANIILQKLGASVWLTFQMLVWGLVALTQSWCTNIHSFYATRFLLGLFEGGYIPGAQYTLALFYTRKELARRTSIFYFGNYGATAIGSLLAAGVVQMAGLKGLSGWQWLFILEGTLTLLVFVFFVAFLPASPSKTAPLHRRWDFFSERERLILCARVVADDESKATDKARMSLKSIVQALLDYGLWVHMILNIVSLAPKGGLQLYGPTIIKSLGFSTVDANLLNSVSSVLVIILSYLIAFGSDKTHLRGPWCVVAFIWSIAFSGALFGIADDGKKWVLYAIFTLLAGGNALAQGLNDAWVSINATNPTNRSMGLALAVIGSNIGGIAGQQLFRSSDAPRYTQSFLAILLLYVSSIIVTLLLISLYWRANKRTERRATGESVVIIRKIFDL